MPRPLLTPAVLDRQPGAIMEAVPRSRSTAAGVVRRDPADGQAPRYVCSDRA